MSTASEPATGQQNEQELLALARALRRSRGEFALFFARCNLPRVRNQLIATLQEILAPLGIQPTQVELGETEELVSIPERLAAAADAGQPVFVIGLEILMPSADPWLGLALLNHRRESFHAIQAPVVLWVPEYVLQQIATRAGDFWAWRSGVYTFQADVATANQALDEGIRPGGFEVANLSLDKKRQRIRLLRALLDDYQGKDVAIQRIRGALLLKLAELHFALGEVERGARDAREVSQIATKIFYPALAATALGCLGFAHSNSRQFPEALNCLQRALTIWRELGNRSQEGAVLRVLGDLHRMAGDFDQAQPCYEAAVTIAEELGDAGNKSKALGGRGSLEMERGNPERAVTYLEEALHIDRKLHDCDGEVARLANLMLPLQTLGRWNAALQAGELALALARDLGNQRGEMYTLRNLGGVYLAQGDLLRAQECFEAALALAQLLGDHSEEASLQDVLTPG